MRERLIREGFITEDGKVLCSLKEFNKYRAYLHKLYQILEKKEVQIYFMDWLRFFLITEPLLSAE